MVKSELQMAFKLSLPTLFAYVPLGIVFGLVFAHSGFAWYLAPLMSLMVFGGSVQFVALSMMTEGANVLAIVIATVFIAFRNSFYGLSLLQRYCQRGLLKFLMIFTLVDATYAILMANPPDGKMDDSRFCVWLSVLVYSYWVFGTLLGAVFSNWVPSFPGLSFILPCFFMVLALEYFLAKRDLFAIITPLVSVIIAYIIFPTQYLLVAILFCVLFILMINTVRQKKT